MRALGIVGFSLAVAAIAALYVCQALGAPPDPKDDPLWVNRSQIWPVHIHDPREWGRQIDVASANRWIYGAVLTLYGQKHGKLETADYTHDVTWNRTHKRFAPTTIQEMLRLANVGLFLGGLALLMALSWRLVGRAWLALLTVVPLALSPTFAGCISYRIGPDAVLFFSMCLMLAFWAAFDLKDKAATRKAVIILGLLAGVSTGCKFNGGLLLAAYCAYLVVYSRGLDRLANPVMACVAAAVAFSLINPAVFVYGPDDYVVAVRLRRLAVMARMNGKWGPMDLTSFLWSSLPIWPIIPALLPVVWRRVPRAVKWCCAFLAVGTIVTINRPAPQYLGPIELGAYYAIALGGALAYVEGRGADAEKTKDGARMQTEPEKAEAGAGGDG